MPKFPIVVLATALLEWNHMALYSGCHAGAWDASPKEIQRIREFLGISWLRAHDPKRH
jgi:hypothetical protein